MKTKSMYLPRLDPELHRLVKVRAAQQGKTVLQVAVEALEQHVGFGAGVPDAQPCLDASGSTGLARSAP